MNYTTLQTIKNMRIDGMSLEAIGKHYGFSKQYIHEILQPYNIKVNVKCKTILSQIDFIRDLRTKGKTWEFIAFELYTTTPTLKKYINFKDFPRWNLAPYQKRCPRCKQIKYKTAFPTYQKPYCKECVKKTYQKRHKQHKPISESF